MYNKNSTYFKVPTFNWKREKVGLYLITRYSVLLFRTFSSVGLPRECVKAFSKIVKFFVHCYFLSGKIKDFLNPCCINEKVNTSIFSLLKFNFF
jgi:hypothetical protein